MTEEFIKTLIDIRNECADADCDDCRFSIGYGHNCCFNGVPCDWTELEELIKQESEE